MGVGVMGEREGKLRVAMVKEAGREGKGLRSSGQKEAASLMCGPWELSIMGGKQGPVCGVWGAV